MNAAKRLFSIMVIAVSVGLMYAEVNCLKVEAVEPAQQAEAELCLSADRFEIEVGDIYMLELELNTGIIQDDWKIEEIKFSQPDGKIYQTIRALAAAGSRSVHQGAAGRNLPK